MNRTEQARQMVADALGEIRAAEGHPALESTAPHVQEAVEAMTKELAVMRQQLEQLLEWLDGPEPALMTDEEWDEGEQRLLAGRAQLRRSTERLDEIFRPGPTSGRAN